MNSKQIVFNFHAQVENLIITPLTCAALVTEFIKILIYEKGQIPYPYSWLKTRVNNRKNPENKSFSIEHQYKLAYNAYTALENLFKSLHYEFKYTKCIDEVDLCFGGNLMTAAEIYKLKVPLMSKDHAVCNHIDDINKNVNKIIRTIMFTPDWEKLSKKSLQPTNMFVFLRKVTMIKNSSQLAENLSFYPIDNFNVPTHSTLVRIDSSNKQTKKLLCCENLDIFQDDITDPIILSDQKNDGKKEENLNENQNIKDFKETFHWYKSNIVFKGFKDCFIDGQSVCNVW